MSLSVQLLASVDRMQDQRDIVIDAMDKVLLGSITTFTVSALGLILKSNKFYLPLFGSSFYLAYHTKCVRDQHAKLRSVCKAINTYCHVWSHPHPTIPAQNREINTIISRVVGPLANETSQAVAFLLPEQAANIGKICMIEEKIFFVATYKGLFVQKNQHSQFYKSILDKAREYNVQTLSISISEEDPDTPTKDLVNLLDTLYKNVFEKVTIVYPPGTMLEPLTHQ